MSITKVSTQVKIGEIIVTHIYLKAMKERESLEAVKSDTT